MRVLTDAASVAGPRALRWDGRSADGRHVAAGVYLVRVQIPGEGDRGILEAKVVVLR